MTVLLDVENLTKTFGDTAVLRGVSLTINAGEVHAVVGANGSGKSTLIKILAGFHAPDPGAEAHFDGEPLRLPLTDEVAKAVGMRFVHQDAPLVGTLSVLDNLALERGYSTGFGGRIRQRAERRRAQTLLERFGLTIDPDRMVEELSAAERMMLCIAREAADSDWQHRLLVLDEPTAALPGEECERLFELIGRIKDQGAGVLYVSHRLAEVIRLADRASILRDGVMVTTLARGEIDHEALVGGMIGETETELYVPPPPVKSTKTRLGISGVSGQRLKDLSTDVREGEIVGVYGLLGCGKSELGRIIAGVQARATGDIHVDGAEVNGLSHDAIEAGIAYIPQDRHNEGVIDSLTVRENLTLARLGPFTRFGRLGRRRERAGAMELIDQFGIVPRDPEKPVSLLSGGNQQKVVIAKWMRCNPRAIVADEPTAGVDVHAKHEIYRFIRAAAEGGAAVLLLSSEAEEVVFACDRVLVLREGELVAELEGNQLTRERVVAASLAK